ncbi:MAG: hypothetical protein P8Q42_03790 [Flavobacteriales bacterium]|nr:hypothetical protein [Flavobacteriales bacterium]
MKTLSTFFLYLPIIGFSQYSASLELHMINASEIIVCFDGKTYSPCSKFELQNLSKGEHELKIYKPKLYLNPSDNSNSKRLVSIYNGSITLAENQYTTCSINKYHQKVISTR